jgi:phosphate transport system substrate-binding protein
MKKLNFVMLGLCVFFLMSHSVYGRDLIQNKGSGTLVNVAQAWAEAYQTVNSNVAVAVTGGGSGTGIAALINGTVDIANASRKMKDKEIKLAEKRGTSPWNLPSAMMP